MGSKGGSNRVRANIRSLSRVSETYATSAEAGGRVGEARDWWETAVFLRSIADSPRLAQQLSFLFDADGQA